jgi:D-cysteine desulfhydrase family pyridoxal phosphate-dependent enzyme
MSDVSDRLDALPRIPLATLPTPLEYLPGISKRLGVEVLIKRDDLTGLGLGGNKARKLEYLMAEAVAADADLVITCGGDQSNHARMTAAACARLGLECELYLCALADPPVVGNLLLDELFGAHTVLLSAPSTLEDCFSHLDEHLIDAASRARGRGRTPYVIAPGGASVAGAIGYVGAMRELAAQLAELGTHADCVVLATGSCGTQAGIEVGLRLFYPRAQAIGIKIADPPSTDLVASLANATAAFLGVSLKVAANDVRLYGDYFGEGYAIPSQSGIAAISELARTDAVVLDPVYTGKAMAGLLDLLRGGQIPSDARVVFLHTGGSPALFAQGDAVLSGIRRRASAGGAVKAQPIS